MAQPVAVCQVVADLEETGTEVEAEDKFQVIASESLSDLGAGLEKAGGRGSGIASAFATQKANDETASKDETKTEVSSATTRHGTLVCGDEIGLLVEIVLARMGHHPFRPPLACRTMSPLAPPAWKDPRDDCTQTTTGDFQLR